MSPFKLTLADPVWIYYFDVFDTRNKAVTVGTMLQVVGLAHCGVQVADYKARKTRKGRYMLFLKVNAIIIKE